MVAGRLPEADLGYIHKPLIGFTRVISKHELITPYKDTLIVTEYTSVFFGPAIQAVTAYKSVNVVGLFRRPPCVPLDLVSYVREFRELRRTLQSFA